LLIGLIPVLLGLTAGRLLNANVGEPEQIVPRLAEAYLPGALYVAFAGAILSAILSAAHAALHAPASQVSHNIIVRAIPALRERGKLWSVRAAVLLLRLVAYQISVYAQRIHDLARACS